MAGRKKHPAHHTYVYGTSYWDRAGVHHINGPFRTEAEADRDLRRAKRHDPDASLLRTTLTRFLQMSMQRGVVSTTHTGTPMTSSEHLSRQHPGIPFSSRARGSRSSRRPRMYHYFTIILTKPRRGATKWHPHEKTGPFSTISRGKFRTERAAHAWARKHIPGTHYRLKRFQGVLE